MKTTPSLSAAAPSPPRPLSASKREHRESCRVAKKLKAGQPGTHKLLKVHGDALLCVRYRHDRLKLYRYTTIELIVDAAPIHRRRFDVATFGITWRRPKAACDAPSSPPAPAGIAVTACGGCAGMRSVHLIWSTVFEEADCLALCDGEL